MKKFALLHNWNILPTVPSLRALWTAKSPEQEGPICTAICVFATNQRINHNVLLTAGITMASNLPTTVCHCSCTQLDICS